MKARDIIDAALVRLYVQFPYYRVGLSSVRFVPIKVDTMCADPMWRVGYSEEKVKAWGVVFTCFVIMHEFYHLLRDHFQRMGARDMLRWNYATDIESNKDLRKCMKILPGALLPESFRLDDNLIAEEYYDQLPEDIRDVDGKFAGKVNEIYKEIAESGVEGLDDFESDIVKNKVAEAIQSYGDAPEFDRLWASMALAPPKVDWRKALRSRIKTSISQMSGATDYTYRRIPKKFFALDAIGIQPPVIPSMFAYKPKVFFVLDVSGSMSGEVVKFVPDILSLAKACGGVVSGASVNTQVVDEAKIRSASDIECLNRGGGGTDLRVGIKSGIEKKADIIVVFTDGITPWPTREEVAGKKIVPVLCRNTVIPQHLGTPIIVN